VPERAEFREVVGMSAARRRSGRGKGGANGGNGNGGNANAPKGQGGGGQGGGGQGGGKAKKKAADFWEVSGASADDLAVAVTVPDDPTALVRSLGAPSLPGQGSNAEHYFTAVYEKASHVAFALATANGLLAGESSDADDADDAEGDDADDADGAGDSNEG